MRVLTDLDTIKTAYQMKNFFRIAATLILAESAYAMNAQEAIPASPEAVIGKLDNGLTYYLWQNSRPKGCADFYIVHNVGALQEEDNQNGLAHFLEHMAFNGTKHYPDKKVLEFLEKEGVRFGYNVNAYTSKYETVYNISSVPLVRESFVDSVLMVLHDWSCDITCDSRALDDERGVISEEWRRRDEPKSRMMMKQNELVYHGAKHNERTVLGTLEIINGFERQEILDFYHKWYRPDLQAIIIVGDYDIQDMERRVRQMFSDIPAQENPAEKTIWPVPALDGPLFENMIDPEIKYHTLKVIHRQPFPTREERGSRFYLQDLFARQIVTTVVEERFKRASRKEDSPLKSAVLVTTPSNVDFYTSMFTLSPKADTLSEEALAFYTREIRRVTDFGFTEDEFNAAKSLVYKKNRLNTLPSADEVQTKEKVNFCKENFLRGIPCVEPSDYKKIQKEILDELDYDFVHGYITKMFTDSEKIYSFSINSKDEYKLPSVERMKEIIEEQEKVALEPEYISYKSLELDAAPQAGRIMKCRPAKDVEGEIWTLSNGATVYWLPSGKVKSNVHLAMTAMFETGYAAFPQDRKGEAVAAKVFLDRYLGLGNMDKTEMKSVSGPGDVFLSVKFGRRYASVNVQADEKDVEKAFKMTYMQLMFPNFSTESVFEKYRRDYVNTSRKGRSNIKRFEKESIMLKYGNDPWLEEPDTANVTGIDYGFVKQIFEDCFSDYRKMTLFVASDLDKDAIKEMVCKYIASLEGKSGVRRAKYTPLLPAYKGTVILDRTYSAESAPKSEVHYCFCTRLPQTPKDRLTIEILDYIMGNRAMNQIREARGGTYHVQFSSDRYTDSKGLTESAVSFKTRPEMTDILVSDVDSLMNVMSVTGPAAEEMETAIKYFVKYRKEKQPDRDNSLRTRLDEGIQTVKYGEDFSYDYETVIRSITAEDVRKTAEKLYNGNRYISIFREQ